MRCSPSPPTCTSGRSKLNSATLTTLLHNRGGLGRVSPFRWKKPSSREKPAGSTAPGHIRKFSFCTSDAERVASTAKKVTRPATFLAVLATLQKSPSLFREKPTYFSRYKGTLAESIYAASAIVRTKHGDSLHENTPYRRQFGAISRFFAILAVAVLNLLRFFGINTLNIKTHKRI